MSVTHHNTPSAFSLYKRLISYVCKYWFAFTLGILGTLVSSATEAGVIGFLKSVLDKGFIAKDPVFIRWLPAIVIMAFLVRGGSGFVSSYFMASVGRNVVMHFRQAIFSHLLRLPARFFDNTTSGQLLSTITYNVDQVAKASTDSLVTVAQETCMVAGLITVMFVISWKLTLLFMITAPIIAGVARYASQRMRGISRTVQEGMGNLTHIAEETIEGYKVVRTFAGENYENEKFRKITEDNRFRELKVVVTNSLSTGITQQVAAIVIAITIYLATAKTSDITAGGFTAMLTAMLAILKPMKSLTTVSSTIQRGIAAAESIFKLLDQETEKDQGTQQLVRAKGKIALNNVVFCYQPQGRPVLKNISFTAEPGQCVALVGKSGSGKSTLVNLLPRFYDDYHGTITIDNIDIRALRLQDLRQQFTLVSQHVVLFNDTIAHNIAYGRWDKVSETEIIKAAEAAHAMEFIRQLPDGLNTRVGENGVLLSGGQRQRIAIARALLKNAPILILDEATSALDTESERHIQEALQQLMINRTTLVIAHRLSTIENADKIIVLDKGNIVESGSHSELLSREGHYHKLYRVQFAELSEK